MSTKSRILILLFFSTYISLFSQGLFEGKIKYAVSVETFQDDHPWNKYLEKKWGDTLVVSHSKDGFQKRDYINSFPQGFSWTIYNPINNNFYSKWHSLDTIYHYNCIDRFSTLEKFGEIKEVEINGEKYKMIELVTKNPTYGNEVRFKYYFDEKLKMNSEFYKNYRDGFFDLLYKKTNSHLIGWTQTEVEVYKVTFKAVEFIEERMDGEVFKIPKGFPLKKD